MTTEQNTPMPHAQRNRVHDAQTILAGLGLPKAQQNERSALCLLALLNLTPEKSWNQVERPLIGITPIIEWVNQYYNYKPPYAPNTRESVRRQSIHQFCQAGLTLHNPDDPTRPVNSKDNVYQVTPDALTLISTFGSPHWAENLSTYLMRRETLIEQYQQARNKNKIPVAINSTTEITFTPGKHSELIRAIIEDFTLHFAPNHTVLYAGDTGKKYAYFDEDALTKLRVKIDSHGKMPDVILYLPEKNWLLLIEAVTSHGPVDGKRHSELHKLFSTSSAGLVYVTAFPNRTLMKRYLTEIAWETEVWVADNPSHLIHFNGERFLGPYTSND